MKVKVWQANSESESENGERRAETLKESRENITFAALFTLTVTGPATLIAGIILIAVSHSERLASIVFVSIFVADLLGMLWWSRRRSDHPRKREVRHGPTRASKRHYLECLASSCEFSQQELQWIKQLIAGKTQQQAIRILLGLPGIRRATIEGIRENQRLPKENSNP